MDDDAPGDHPIALSDVMNGYGKAGLYHFHGHRVAGVVNIGRGFGVGVADGFGRCFRPDNDRIRAKLTDGARRFSRAGCLDHGCLSSRVVGDRQDDGEGAREDAGCFCFHGVL